MIQKGPYPACPSRNIPNLKVPGQVTDRMRPHLHQPEGEPRRTYIPGAPTVGNHRADTMDANIREAERWLRQGSGTSSVQEQLPVGEISRACFQAQQSAEKSLKALLYARGYRRILTHSVYELIREIGEYEASFLTLKSKAKALDAAYITTRYPDSIVGNLTPSEYYDREDAEECIEHADSICSAARRALAG